MSITSVELRATNVCLTTASHVALNRCKQPKRCQQTSSKCCSCSPTNELQLSIGKIHGSWIEVGMKQSVGALQLIDVEDFEMHLPATNPVQINFLSPVSWAQATLTSWGRFTLCCIIHHSQAPKSPRACYSSCWLWETSPAVVPWWRSLGFGDLHHNPHFIWIVASVTSSTSSGETQSSISDFCGSTDSANWSPTLSRAPSE